MKTINMFPATEQDLTPSEFLSVLKKNREEIQEVRIIPPKIGARGFGKLRVIKKTTTYHPDLKFNG